MESETRDEESAMDAAPGEIDDEMIARQAEEAMALMKDAEEENEDDDLSQEDIQNE